MIDELDRKILAILQEDARASNVSIARQLNLAPSAMLERIRKLRQQGIIEEYTAKLDPRQLDSGMLAFVFIKTNERNEKWDVGTQLAQIPEVLEVHDIAGDDCYMMKIRTKDTDSLYRLLRDKLGGIAAITSSRTTIVLRTVKETSKIPLDASLPAFQKKKRNGNDKKKRNR